MVQLMLRKDLDAVFLAKTVLKRLGAGRLDSFLNRLLTQKIQYFAQVFRVSTPYTFNLYLRGPYSPDLSHDLFQIQSLPVDEVPFVAPEVEARFNALQTFILGKKERQLELLATFHWFMTVAKYTESEADTKLIEWKKASTEELSFVHQEIKKVPT